MLSYLWKRNATYYYRIKIPSDLSSFFPTRLLRVSLKTRDADAAKITAANLHRMVQNNFALLRSGAMDAEVCTQLVKAIMPEAKRYVVVEVEGREDRGPTLSDMISAYVTDRSPGWTEKTKLEFACQFQVLLRILGDRPAQDISRIDLINCREVLRRLPPNFSKRKNLREIHPIELSKRDWEATLKPKSINRYVSILTALFTWMHKNGSIANNIAAGLTLPIETSPQEERKPYSAVDIERIKGSLPRDNRNPERYWIPLIAMYQGMRLDEICQLHLDDVRMVDGLPCFDINDGGERNVKTNSSKRIVPIHPALISDGLLEYVDGLREREAVQLWENIRPDKLGDWGKWFGNWYGRFNRKFVTDDPLKVFHSFRHTVADTLKQKGVAEGIIAEILGHANGSITTGRYGKRYRPAVLLEALKKLDY